MFMTLKISPRDPAKEVDNTWLLGNANKKIDNTSENDARIDTPLISVSEFKIHFANGQYYLINNDEFIQIKNNQKIVIDKYCVSLEITPYNTPSSLKNKKNHSYLMPFQIKNENSEDSLKSNIKKYKSLFDNNNDALGFLEDSTNLTNKTIKETTTFESNNVQNPSNSSRSDFTKNHTNIKSLNAQSNQDFAIKKQGNILHELGFE